MSETPAELLDKLVREMRVVESRLTTTLAVARSMVNATDPDTDQGREARKIYDDLRRIQDELGGIDS